MASLAGGESLSTSSSIPLSSFGARGGCEEGARWSSEEDDGEEEQRGKETLKRRRWVWVGLRKGEGSRRERWVWEDEGVRVEGFMVPSVTTSCGAVCRGWSGLL